MKNLLLAVLACLAILITTNHLCFAQANNSGKIKQRVEQIGIGKKITVIKLDNRKVYGSVSFIEADGFQIKNADKFELVDFKYSELKKVRGGYGEKSLSGRRASNSLRSVLITAAVAGALLGLLVFALSKDK